MPFSLSKFKTKVERRFSEPADFDRGSLARDDRRNSLSNVVIVVTESETLRASSTPSIPSNIVPRSRLRSVSKKQAKELIRQETSLVIQKKLFSLLKDLGLQPPIPLKTSSSMISSVPSKLVNVHVANTNDCLFLAPALSTSFTYEDDENGGSNVPEPDSMTDFACGIDDGSSLSAVSTPRLSLSSSSDTSEPLPPEDILSAIMNTISKIMRALKSANYLRSQIDSLTMLPHLFAVIVELQKDSSTKTVEVEFLSVTKTLWPIVDGQIRHLLEEKFKIGKLKWDLSLDDADFYINANNTRDTRLRDINPHHLAKRTREYRLVDARTTSNDSLDERSSLALSRHSAEFLSQAGHEPPADVQKAGLYVFLLPILFPANIPATVNTSHGTLSHRLTVKVPGPNERMSKKSAVKAEYDLPMVRTPPSLAYSVADKPIYINRVWNESLHYSIIFPRKYAPLGCEHTINVKLVPLTKDVIVKRIKFNVLERVTYVSKDLTKDYEYDGDDPYARSKNPKAKERIVALCELRTRTKNTSNGLEPFKEEVLSCPENNLLYSCYERENLFDGGMRTSKDRPVMVASPIDINIALPFLTSRADKELITSNVSDHDGPSDWILASSSSRSHSMSRRGLIASLESPSLPNIGSLETHISHSNSGHLFSSIDADVLRLDSLSLLPKKQAARDPSIGRGYTTMAKALSPDSNYRHIQVSHRLQVAFRISKPDVADNNKMHHYEVVVDTPIILLSAKCSDGALQLPEYAEDKTQTSTMQTERPAGINFRTPSYVKDGVSIKPFDPTVCDKLPSFEEATMTLSSINMRSSSVTSMDPSTPSNPPAYENVSHQSERNSSQENPRIDDMLNETYGPLNRKPSSIRASLENSFAQPPVLRNRSSSGSGLSSNGVSLTDDSSKFAQSEGIDNSASSDDSSTLSMHSDLEASNGNVMDFSELTEGILDDPVTCVNNSNENIVGSKNSEVHSATKESQFVQRLPLLRNESMGGLELQEESTVKNRGLTSNEWSKMLMETLNEESQPQSLFHAY